MLGFISHDRIKCGPDGSVMETISTSNLYNATAAEMEPIELKLEY